MSTISKDIDAALGQREAQGLLRNRHHRPINGPSGPHILVNGQSMLNFASNSYLGLSVHPKVIEAWRSGAKEFGTSSAASRLVTGNTSISQELEKALAKLKNSEDALLMSSGYQANLGVLQAIDALYQDQDLVLFSDALNHASLVDGCRQTRAQVIIYPHRDTAFLRKALRAHDGQAKFIITESRFSMDGDVAPLSELAALKREFQAGLFVDEAHATGIDGEGRGLLHSHGLSREADFVVGTLGKALGTHGAFVAGARNKLRWIENTARSFIYSTALPGAVAAATLAALEVLQDERPFEKLAKNVTYFRHALSTKGLGFLIAPEADGPILPIIVGSPDRALNLQKSLESKNILAVAMRPPTVLAGTCRVRLSLRADHSEDDLDKLAEALLEVGND